MLMSQSLSRSASVFCLACGVVRRRGSRALSRQHRSGTLVHAGNLRETSGWVWVGGCVGVGVGVREGGGGAEYRTRRPSCRPKPPIGTFLATPPERRRAKRGTGIVRARRMPWPVFPNWRQRTRPRATLWHVGPPPHPHPTTIPRNKPYRMYPHSAARAMILVWLERRLM